MRTSHPFVVFVLGISFLSTAYSQNLNTNLIEYHALLDNQKYSIDFLPEDKTVLALLDIGAENSILETMPRIARQRYKSSQEKRNLIEKDSHTGPWEQLELQIRNLNDTNSQVTIFIMNGPEYNVNQGKLNSGAWKIASVREDDAVKIAAFFVDQKRSLKTNECANVFNIDEINQLGAGFYSGLSEKNRIQLQVKMAEFVSDWGC